MNKTTGFLFCFVVAALALSASAQVGPVGPDQSQILNLPTAPSTPAAKAKSVLAGMPPQPEDNMRDPFWPIDFVPPSQHIDVAPVVTNAPALPERNWAQAEKGLAIKGIIQSGNSYVATINDKIVGQNETVSVMYDGLKYTWRIASISSKSVQFQPDEAASEQKSPL